MSGHHFLSDNEVKTAVKVWFCPQDAELYLDRLMKVPEHWRKCVGNRTDFVEK
jgi:hypothetical protein